MMREAATSPGESAGTGRGHDVLPHTADTGLRAWAPDLPGLFEEAAGALAEIAAEVANRHDRGDARDTAVTLEARDLVGLAFAWLSELVGLADATHSALVETRIARIEQGPEGWRLEGSARFVGPHPGAVRPRHDVKSATYHGLEVERTGGGWSLSAYLDI